MTLLIPILLLFTVHAADLDREYGIRRGSYVCWYGSSLDKEHTRKYGDKNFKGEKIDWEGDFAASWSFPYGTILEIRHKDKKVRVKVIDRGGHRRPNEHKHPIICELTPGAFKKLAPLKVGKLKVKIIVLDKKEK